MTGRAIKAAAERISRECAKGDTLAIEAIIREEAERDSDELPEAVLWASEQEEETI